MIDWKTVDINEITKIVIGAAIRVHTELGPGLLESAYEFCLCHELELQGVPFEQQKPLPVVYIGKAARLWVSARYFSCRAFDCGVKGGQRDFADPRSTGNHLYETVRLQFIAHHQL